MMTREGVDCSWHALWILSSALEYPLASEQSTVEKLDAKYLRSSGPGLHFVIAAGEFWISQCISVIHENSKNEVAGTKVKGPLWDGKEGFSIARYQMWMRRFDEYSRNDNIQQATRDLAAKAALEMKKIEA